MFVKINIRKADYDWIECNVQTYNEATFKLKDYGIVEIKIENNYFKISHNFNNDKWETKVLNLSDAFTVRPDDFNMEYYLEPIRDFEEKRRCE